MKQLSKKGKRLYADLLKGLFVDEVDESVIELKKRILPKYDKKTIEEFRHWLNPFEADK